MKYDIQGEPMPVVICQLEAGETLICESGAMNRMSPNMEMQTGGGGPGKLFSRMFSGENLFQSRYTAGAGGPVQHRAHGAGESGPADDADEQLRRRHSGAAAHRQQRETGKGGRAVFLSGAARGPRRSVRGPPAYRW